MVRLIKLPPLNGRTQTLGLPMMRQVFYNCATTAVQTKILPRKSSLGIRLSTIDLLVLTGSYQLLHALKIVFTFFTKQATLMRRSTVLSLHFS